MVAQKMIDALGAAWKTNLCVTSESWLPPWERNYSVVVQLGYSDSYGFVGSFEVFTDGTVSTEGIHTGKLHVRRALKAAGFKVVAKAA